MTPREAGFLLLTCHLGDPDRHPMTVAQLRKLAQRVREHSQWDMSAQLEPADLMALGYGEEAACHIAQLLSQQEQLDWYVAEGKKQGCVPVTRVSEGYPLQMRKRLGLDSPGCLWVKGDPSLLGQPSVALVGSRELGILNEAFAIEAGRQAALQGYVLVSGNAKGADRTAQDSCLYHGGRVISVVADELEKCVSDKNILYLSEEGYDLPFTAQRALSRNRVIHSLPKLTLVAQCRKGKGGTWDGTVKNLKNLWSPVFCLDDGSEGIDALCNLCAECITGSQLEDFSALQPMPKLI